MNSGRPKSSSRGSRSAAMAKIITRVVSRSLRIKVPVLESTIYFSTAFSEPAKKNAMRMNKAPSTRTISHGSVVWKVLFSSGRSAVSAGLNLTSRLTIADPVTMSIQISGSALLTVPAIRSASTFTARVQLSLYLIGIINSRIPLRDGIINFQIDVRLSLFVLFIIYGYPVVSLCYVSMIWNSEEISDRLSQKSMNETCLF